MKYLVVEGSNSKKLEEKVNDLIDLGWRLHGGISVSVFLDAHGLSRFYAQALVKLDAEETALQAFDEVTARAKGKS